MLLEPDALFEQLVTQSLTSVLEGHLIYHKRLSRNDLRRAVGRSSSPQSQQLIPSPESHMRTMNQQVGNQEVRLCTEQSVD